MSNYVYPKMSSSDLISASTSGKGNWRTFMDGKYADRQWKPSEGTNCIRILPPPSVWSGKLSHYGLPVHRHMNVGGQFWASLCHDHAINDELIPGRATTGCPVCHYASALWKAGDKEGFKKAAPKFGVLVWLVDRFKQGEGPKWWILPTTFNQSLCLQAANSSPLGSGDPTNRGGEPIPFNHPEKGYDITFNMVKQANFPKYENVVIGREASPLSPDPSKVGKYLEWVDGNPLHKMVKYDTVEELRKACGASSTVPVHAVETSHKQPPFEPTSIAGVAISQVTEDIDMSW